MKFELKYKKYKNKYLNLKKLYGGTHFEIQDPNLKYYHVEYVELNSSITIYGEKHELEYNNFLLNYIDALYSTKRRQIIILEMNELELMQENQTFKKFMEQGNTEEEIIRKKRGIRLVPSPILYFSAVYKHSGNFPNTEIICGDIRLKNIFNLIMQLDEMTELHPDNIIDNKFLTEFKAAWAEQLSYLTTQEYSEIIDETHTLLEEILPTMKNEEVESISNRLNDLWIQISNISMLHYIKEHINKDIDITLFVGALHMSDLIERIEKIYPSLVQEDKVYYIQSPKLSNQDDNFDDDQKYSEYWFKGEKRLTGREIEPNVYYWIRFKNSKYSFVNYKLNKIEGDKIILEQADGMPDKKFIKLDINNIYAYAII